MGNASVGKRAGLPFSWSVTGGIEAMGTLAGVRFDLLFRDVDSIVLAYAKGGAAAREMFGPDVGWAGPGWAGISYGHINCLGAELVFPEDSEVAHRPTYGNLREAVDALSTDVDFTRQGLFPFYLELWENLKKAFPKHTIPFGGFGAEGPLTTAWLLRGHDFFMDLYDDPPLAKKYLALVTRSVVRYQQTLARINGNPDVSPSGAFLVDDGAAMIPPPMWPEFVLPFLQEYYTALTTGTRGAHIEDLRAPHLGYLDDLGLDHYDPSVSPRLTPALIRDSCNVPFYWRLNETEYTHRLTDAIVQQWVTNAAENGAAGVRTSVWRNNCTPPAAQRIATFIRAARRVEARGPETRAYQ